ncbi:MAG: hypothetical protein ACOVLB_02935 [Candidatus Nanopelagicus sp.]
MTQTLKNDKPRPELRKDELRSAPAKFIKKPVIRNEKSKLDSDRED